jgi:hypothetical protein
VIAILLAVSAADFDWTQSALFAVVAAAARTALSGVLPGGSFGNSPESAVGEPHSESPDPFEDKQEPDQEDGE